MEILSTRPQCLTLEARHTISLQVAKQRRLRVASSLFMPRKNRKTNEDEMNQQDPESSMRAARPKGANKKRAATKPTVSSQNMSYNIADNRAPYDPRVSLSSLETVMKYPTKYTTPTPAHKTIKKPQKITSTSAVLDQEGTWKTKSQTQSLEIGEFVKVYDASNADTSPGVKSSQPEEINQPTSTGLHQSCDPSFDPITIVDDDVYDNRSLPPIAEENHDLIEEKSQNESTHSRGPITAPPFNTFIPNTLPSHEISANDPPADNHRNQQITWQISIPTPETSGALVNNGPSAPLNSLAAMTVKNGQLGPLTSLAAMTSENSLKNTVSPSNRLQIHETGICLPSRENFRQFAAVGEPIHHPSVYGQGIGPHISQEIYRQNQERAHPSKGIRGIHQSKPIHKSPERSRRQESQNQPKIRTPPNVYHHSNPPPYGCPKPVYTQQFMYFICPPSESHSTRVYTSENCHSYSQPNHAAQEIRYHPYQYFPRPPIMYHQLEMEPVYPSNHPTSALPASLAPADMAKWLASRYQQALPQPPPDYVSMEHQLSNYQQALVRYAEPPQTNHNYMNSFCGQYMEAPQSGVHYRPPDRQYGLPKMSNPGPSNCYPHQGFFQTMKTGMNCPPGATQYCHPRVLPCGPPPPAAVRFPGYNQEPIQSHHLGELPINERIPEEFYRSTINLPEYDPRDNR